MDSITIHGLPRIFRSKRVSSKVVWALLFLVCCIVLTIVLVGRVEEFQQNKVRLEISKISTTRLPLPSLTICDSDEYSHGDEFDPFPVSCAQQNGMTSSNLFRYGCKLFLSNVSFSCVYDFNSDCRFPRHFSPARSWNRCYTFNSNGSAVQSFNEKFNGVDMLLFKGEPELYRRSLLHTLRNLHQGLKLFVHPANELLGLSQKGAILLTPGQRTEVAVKKMVVKRKPAPFPANCSSNTSVKQMIGGSYTVKNCQSSCLLNLVYEECGSVLANGRPFMPVKDYPNTDKFVGYPEFDACFKKNLPKLNFFKCDCPVPCEEEIYVTEVSTRPWTRSFLSSPKVKDGLAQFFNISRDEVTLDRLKNLIHLSVYYEDFTTEHVIEHEWYALGKLLCDFGGLMGLLIGASVISLVEIVWALSKVLLKRCKAKEPSADNTEL